MSRGGKLAAALAAAFLVALALLALNLGRLVDLAMTPGAAFAPETAPPAPDYSNAASWSALPDRDDAADRVPTGSPAVDQRQAPADVFYVHPTSYVGSHWNAPVDDPGLNAGTDRAATAIQAPAFNGCCAIWAPRYRQANGTAFYRPSGDGDGAITLAYGDVRRAFEAFQSKRGGSRPFILASHSQGSVLAERLLHEVVSKTPLRDQLVAAYVIGGRVTVEGLRERAPDLAPCRAADDVRCVVAWNARSPEYRPSVYELRRTDPRALLCTNPLSWRIDEAPATAELNLGAVFLEADGAPRPGFADARCGPDGVLLVSRVGEAPRDLPSRVLDHVMGEGNYHPVEYQLFFMNLRRNAEQRTAAFLAAYSSSSPR